MEKKIEDYVGLYIPCDGFYKEDGKDVHVKILGVSINEGLLEHQRFDDPECDVDWWNTENFVLSLRQFKNITPDEMKEMFEMVFHRKFPENGRIAFFAEQMGKCARFCLMSGVDRLGIEMDGTIWADCDLNHFPYNQHEITKYLLLKQFDLFDLIKSGIALPI